MLCACLVRCVLPALSPTLARADDHSPLRAQGPRIASASAQFVTSPPRPRLSVRMHVSRLVSHLAPRVSSMSVHHS